MNENKRPKPELMSKEALAAMIQEGLDQLTYPESAHAMYEPVSYTLQAGGKRLRPMLVLAAANIYGADPASALNAALGIEMYHNFTLLHDDVMDKAPMRRGRPTVHTVWNDNQAILSGDAMVGLAYQLISKVPPRVLKPVLDVFNTMNQEICQGQQYDMEFETRDDVTIEEYLEMIRLKTSVLLGRALQIGAYIGQDQVYGALHDIGVERYDWLDKDIDTFFDYGCSHGLAFQLQDDWLDCWGNPATFGKRIGGDILEGKQTYLRIMAKSVAPEPDTTGMTDAQKIEAYKEYYVRTGAEEACRKAIRHYTNDAKNYIEKLSLPAEKQSVLRSIFGKLDQRKS